MNCITQMDLGRWFRNIEYLYGILNSINEKKNLNICQYICISL